MSEHTFRDYPFSAENHVTRLPALVGAEEIERHPVVVVGGGPVGLTLALGLANYGIRTVLIEQDASVCFGSRAICVSRRSLQIIERLGALRPFIEKGLPWTGGRSFFRNTEVLHFQMPHDDNQKLPPMLNIEQFYIEHFLLEQAKSKPDLIDIRWNATVTHVENHDDGVVIDLSTPLGEYRMRSDWLVACDGGRSFIRESMGLALKGTSYEGRYVIADIHLESSMPTGRLAWFDPPSNPGSSILMHKQPDNVWRIDYQLAPEEDAEEAIKPENVIPRVQQHLDMIGEKGPWSPIWITIYKAHALTLDEYRHGRTLFAGDAAHLLPIFGVRGANSGIDDADNLAWKLALTIKGQASPGVLESYSAERVYAAHENLRHGSKSTEFMTPPSFAFELMRRSVLTLAIQEESVRSLINPRQTSTITYLESPLIDRKNEDSHFEEGPPLGAAIPEGRAWIVLDGAERDGFLTDLVSPHFNLLCFTESGEIDADLEEYARTRSAAGVELRLVRIAASHPNRSSDSVAWDKTREIFRLYGARVGNCYLVRPDGYVLGRWLTTSPEAIDSALSTVLPVGDNA